MLRAPVTTEPWQHRVVRRSGVAFIVCSLLACTPTPAPPSSSPSPARAGAPSVPVTMPRPDPRPAALLPPAIEAQDDVLVLRLPVDVTDHRRVVVVEGRGPVSPDPDCRDGRVILDHAIAPDDGGRELALDTEGDHALRACVFRASHPRRAAASVTRPGERHGLWSWTLGNGCEATTRIDITRPLDGDVVAVELRALPETELVPSSEEICASGRRLRTLPAAIWDGLAGIVDGGFDVNMGVDLHKTDLDCGGVHRLQACLRLEDGSLFVPSDDVSNHLDRRGGRVRQTTATPVGPIVLGELDEGHHLLGYDVERDETVVVVAQRVDHRPHATDLRVAMRSGREVIFGAEELVWEAGQARFVRASTLTQGSRLRHLGGGDDVVAQPPERLRGNPFSTVRLDVSAPDTFFRGGFLVRDDERSPARTRLEATPPKAPPPGVTLTPHPASFDCSVGVRLSLADLPQDLRAVTLHAAPPTTPAGRVPPPRCPEEEPLLTLGADHLRRGSSALDGAPLELDLELGMSQLSCSTGYAVFACGKRSAGPERPLASTFAVSGPSCLVEGTPVDTPTGPVAIERLSAGMDVFAWDASRKAVVTTTVVHVKRRAAAEVATIAMSDGRSLRATRDHPFFLPLVGHYRTAEGLHHGDVVLTRSGTRLTVTAVSAFDSVAPVVDVSVAGPHNFFANGVLVHNY